MKNPEYVLDELSILMWRNGKKIPGDHKKYCFCEEPAPVPTLSGKKEVIKYWLWYAQAGDVVRLYQELSLQAGDRISANVISFDNTCDVWAALVAFSPSENKELKSDYISLSGKNWKKLSLILDSNKYKFINLELCVKQNSVLHGKFNGMDGFIDDFKIIHQKDLDDNGKQ